MLWVTYEDLKADLVGEVAKVATFIGIDLATQPDLPAIVAKHSTFDVMKQQFAENDAKALQEGKTIKKNHIREGKVRLQS